MIDQTLSRIVDVRRRLLHLVDHAPDLVVTPRRPSRREQDATDRRDGRFAPTPAGTSRPSARSDPTLRAVMSREREVQDHTTRLWEIVSATDDIIRAPTEPSTRLTLTGRAVIDDSLVRCRTHIVVGCDHLEDVCGHVASQRRLSGDDDAAAWWDDRISQIDRDLRRLTGRIGPVKLRMCRAGCGAPAPPYGQGATCVRCRQARSRTSTP